MTSVFQLVCELCRKCKKCCILVHWSLLLFTTQKFPHPNKQKETGFICSMSVRVLKLHFSFSFFCYCTANVKVLMFEKVKPSMFSMQSQVTAFPYFKVNVSRRKFYPSKVYVDLSIYLSIRAGRYDQKFISRYFSKLYRFHGI